MKNYATEMDRTIVNAMELDEVQKIFSASNVSPTDADGDFNEMYPDCNDFAHEKCEELGFTSYWAMKDALWERIKRAREEREKAWLVSHRN